MKKRTAATGAGAVGLVALGLMYLPDWDFGSLGVPRGGGDVTDLTLDPTRPDEEDQVEPAPTFNEEIGTIPGDGPGTGEGGLVEDGPAEGTPLAVVDVLVDGGEYLVLRGFAADGLPKREGMSLSGVLDLASRVEGAPDGVKVRVSRTPNAIAGAATDLTTALTAAGFVDDEVDYRLRLVEDPAPGFPGEGGYDGQPRPSDVPGRNVAG